MKRKPKYRVIEQKLGQMPGGPDVNGLWRDMKDVLDWHMPQDEDKARPFWLRINRIFLIIPAAIFVSSVVFTLVVLNEHNSENLGPISDNATTAVADPTITPSESSPVPQPAEKSAAPVVDRKDRQSKVTNDRPSLVAKDKPVLVADKKRSFPSGAATTDVASRQRSLTSSSGDMQPAEKMEAASMVTQKRTAVKKQLYTRSTPAQQHIATIQKQQQPVVSNNQAPGSETTGTVVFQAWQQNRIYPASPMPLLNPGSVFLPNRQLATGAFDTVQFPVGSLMMNTEATARFKRFAVGAAVHLNLPVSNQEMSTVSANGTNNKLIDYMPSVYGQYYFHKKMYLQSEFQFITPQHTPNLKLSSTTISTGPNRKQVHSVQLTKLYYMNLPVSLHYQVLPHLYVGAGIQYSYLTRSVLTEATENWQNGNNGWEMKTSNAKVHVRKNPKKEKDKMKLSNPSNPTAVVVTPVDVVAQKFRSNDWRFTYDINYYHRRFYAGIRFNMGINNYIDTEVGNTNLIVEDKNKSFQAYIRYQIWEWKK